MREQFVCARITSLNRANLNRFEFDYDTTWNAFFLDADLNVYSRYGGRDDGPAEGRLSKESLLQTMQEVLDVHKRGQSLPPKQRLAELQPVPADTFTPDDIPLLKKNHQGCVHCHQVREYTLLQSFHDGQFEREQLFPFPLPENVGLAFDRKHGYRVEKVEPASAAAEAGLQPGDVVLRVDDVPIRSEYDFRWVLHRKTGDAPLTVVARRPREGAESETIHAAVALRDNWRQTEIGWRKSLRSVPFPMGFRGYALTRSQRKEAGLTEEQLAIRVISILSRGLGKEIGLEKHDTIVAVDEFEKDRSFDEFKSFLLRRYQPGDEIVLTVLREERSITLKGRFPDWFIDETSVP
jgi:hypothetical protein